MAMGRFTRRPQYQQQNAMGNAGALLGLLKEQSNQIEKIGGAVDEYGQSRVRGKVSDLMGTEEFQGMNPEQAQAAIAALTGGRDLGKNFMQTLGMSDDNKSNVQKNNWNEEAATLSHGRAMSKQAQGHANSVSLSKMNNSARQKLYGTKTAGSTSGASNELLDLQHDVVLLQEEMNDDFTTPERKKELQNQINRKKIRTEQAIKKGGHNAGAGLSLMNSVFGQGGGGSSVIKGSKNLAKWGASNGFIRKKGKDTFLLDDQGNWMKSKGDTMTSKYLQMRANG